MDTQELSEAKKFFSLPASRPLALRIGGQSRFFIVDPITRKRYEFSWRQYQLLRFYTPERTLEEACELSEMPVDKAKRFLASKKFRNWVALQQNMAIQAKEWKSRDRWWAIGGHHLESGIEMTDTQKLVWKEFGERIEIKPSRNGEKAGVQNITINISKEDLEDVRKHEEILEARVVS